MAGRHAADHPPKKFHNAEWRNFLGFPLTPPLLVFDVPQWLFIASQVVWGGGVWVGLSVATDKP
ncbi:hypothetical protein FHC47_20875 [Klebsiella quasipneumoniae]|nr:hypothetical protein FHC47_20875 [Klebsiella quasipneumoniae]